MSSLRRKVILISSVVLLMGIGAFWAMLPCPLSYYLSSWKATRYQSNWPMTQKDYANAKRTAGTMKGAFGAVISGAEITSPTKVKFRITQGWDEVHGGVGFELTLEKDGKVWRLTESGFWTQLGVVQE